MRLYRVGVGFGGVALEFHDVEARNASEARSIAIREFLDPDRGFDHIEVKLIRKPFKERQIMVVIKEPGKPARVDPLFDNTLDSFQRAVGGYIECVTVAEDLVLICNEEGRLMGLPFNLDLMGVDFVGTVVAAGVHGDYFASIRGSAVAAVLDLLGR